MDIVYPYANILHLILAIMFLGYVFTDLVVLSALKGKFEKETQQKIAKALGGRSFKIFPLTLLFLILTGGIMSSKHINYDVGFFTTNLQKLLIFKIFLVFIITLGVASNLYYKLTGGTKSHFMQHHFHKLVILLGIFIVILAKLMFYI